MRRIYYGNKLISTRNAILGFAFSGLLCIPWILKYSFSPGVVLILIVLALLWSFYLVMRINFLLMLVIDEEKILLYEAFLGIKPISFLWKGIARIQYVSVVNILLIRTPDRKHNLGLSSEIKDYKTAYRDIVEQALKSNPSILISPKTLEKLRKKGIL